MTLLIDEVGNLFMDPLVEEEEGDRGLLLVFIFKDDFQRIFARTDNMRHEEAIDAMP